MPQKKCNGKVVVKRKNNKNLTRQHQPNDISNFRFGFTLVITFIFIGSLYLLSDINPQTMKMNSTKNKNSLVIEDKSITNSKAINYDFHDKLIKDKVEVDYSDDTKNKVKSNISKYFIQVGSFRDAEKAEMLLVELKLLGLNPHIKTVSSKLNEEIFRVQLGPYDLNKMTSERKKLFKNNFESIIKPVK